MILGSKIFYGRRPTYRSIGTSLDPFQDLISWVGYLVSTEYTEKCLIERHGFNATDAAHVSKQVTYHAQMAQSLLKKSVDTSDETAFLDGYYGILNLMKIYILFSPFHAALPQNRLHGITFKPFDESPQNFQCDKVVLKQSGTMSLFYKVLTGDQISGDIPVDLSNVLPWLSGVTYEYELSSGVSPRILLFNIQKEDVEGKIFGGLNLINHDGCDPSAIRSIPLLQKLREHSSKPFWYMGRESTREEKLKLMVRDLIDPIFCFRNSTGYICTPLYSQVPKMVQELPIALFFFAMSSIIRYYPTYSFALKNSKWAPLLFASRRHALLEFLILFWSQIQNEDYYLNEG